MQSIHISKVSNGELEARPRPLPGPPIGPSPTGCDAPSQPHALLRTGTVQAAVLLGWPTPGGELCGVWPHAVWAASGLGPGRLWTNGASLATCHVGSRRSLEASLMTPKGRLPAAPPGPAARPAGARGRAVRVNMSVGLVHGGSRLQCVPERSAHVLPPEPANGTLF